MSVRVLEGRERGLRGERGYCAECRQWMPEGPDVCLGVIPGVSHACCGHGDAEQAYVVLGGEPDQSCSDFRSLTFRGLEALEFFALVEQGEVWEPSS